MIINFVLRFTGALYQGMNEMAKEAIWKISPF